MPTSYIDEVEAHSFSEYRKALDEQVPNLFDGKYSTFQNDCSVSGILRVNVGTDYRKIQIAKTL